MEFCLNVEISFSMYSSKKTLKMHKILSLFMCEGKLKVLIDNIKYPNISPIAVL